MKKLKNDCNLKEKNIGTRILIITIISILVLGLSIMCINKNLTERNKQIATEKITSKISTIKINKYVQKQIFPTLEELSETLKDDNEIEYITQVSKIQNIKYEVEENQNLIYIKLNQYPYEFEIDSSLQLVSIDGTKIESNSIEQKIKVSVDVIEKKEDIYKCLLIFSSNDDKEKIKFVEYPKIEGKEIKLLQVVEDGRTQIGIDYEINRNDVESVFKIITSNGNVVEKEIIKHVPNIFEYITEPYHEFEIKITGNYRIECWGATGGNATGISQATGTSGQRADGKGGKGGYTSGEIYLQKGEKLYVYVGGHGADAISYRDSLGGYNGGGLGTWDHRDDEAAGAGGGATDIRLVSGLWNDFQSLKSRIMVAAGGAGAAWKTNGGAGGGWEGLTNRIYSVPGTQTSGYKFGIGQDGYGVGKNDGVAGSGGGYYGGTTSDIADAAEAGAGGSSFISGNENCNAISIESTEGNIIHTKEPIHYSGKYFINSFTEDGNSLTHVSLDSVGNGFAKIRLLDK